MADDADGTTLAELDQQRSFLVRALLDPLPASQRNAALSAMHDLGDGRVRTRTYGAPPSDALPAGWLEDNQDRVSRWIETGAALERRRLELVESAALHQPDHIHVLGPRPERGPQRQRWERAVTAVEEFRDRYGVTAPDALGPRPDDTAVRRDWERARKELEAGLRALGRGGPGRGIS